MSNRVGLLTRVSLLALEAGLAMGMAQNAQAASCGVLTGSFTGSCTGPATWNTGSLNNSGTISGGSIGVSAAGGPATLTNSGVISGIWGVNVGPNGFTALVNSGTITGASRGMDIQGAIGTLTNTGTISSSAFGIYFEGAGSIGTVTNSVGGIITGRTGILLNGTGVVISILSNAGTISGTKGIDNRATIVTLTNSGSISAIVNSGLIGGAVPTGLNNSGTIGTLSTGGTITGSGIGASNTGSITGLINSGTIGGGSYGVYNSGTIGMLNNTIGGRISGGGGVLGAVHNIGSIGVLSNSGTLTASGYVVQNGTQFTAAGSIGTVTNSGTIIGASQAFVNWVTIGTITNTGLISAVNAINTTDTLGKLDNGGTINGVVYINGNPRSSTVDSLVNSGLISNTVGSAAIVLSAADATVVSLINNGTISARSGIGNSGSIGSLSNSGTISGTNYAILNTGTIGTITNNATGILTGGVTAIRSDTGAIGTLSNSGTIITTSPSGPAFSIGLGTATGSIGLLDNGGLIQGAALAIKMNGIVTSISNSGTISASAAGGFALLNNGSTSIGSVTNTGTIEATATGGIAVYNNGASAVMQALDNTIGGLITGGLYGVENVGTIGLLSNSGAVTGITGVRSTGSIGMISNAGTIGGSSNGFVSTGTFGTLTNTGSIAGHSANSGNGLYGIENAGTGDTVANNGGTITADTAVIDRGTLGALTNSGALIGVDVGFINGTGSLGVLTNMAGGTIRGGNTVVAGTGVRNAAVLSTLTNAGTITGSNRGILSQAGGTITLLNNSGLISGASASGIGIGAGTISTLTNSGTISGASFGIDNATSIATLANNAGGTISGAIAINSDVGSTIGTLTNAGVISSTNVNVPTVSIGGILGGLNNSGAIDAVKIGIKVTGTDTILTNSGTFSVTGVGVSGSAIGIETANGVIGTLTNNGTVSVAGAQSWGILNQGGTATIGTLINNSTGTIASDFVGVGNLSGTILNLNNAGIITGNGASSGQFFGGVYNNSTIVTLINSGTINGTAEGINNAGTIVALTNSTGGSISAILNRGLIGGAASTGLIDNGTIGSISNASTGTIIAAASGISAASGTIGTLTNAGTITTASGSAPAISIGIGSTVGSLGLLNNSGVISAAKTAIKMNGIVSTIINSGTILASLAGGNGLLNNGSTSIGTIVNSGTIEALAANGRAVFNNGATGFMTVLSNTIGGLLDGGIAGIDNAGTIVTLSNSGTVIGAVGIFANGTTNTLTNSGTISGTTKGINNRITIGTLANTGTISASAATGIALNNGGGIGTIVNSGTIMAVVGNGIGVENESASAVITALNNTIGGLITGGTLGVKNVGTITLLSNSGAITGLTGILNSGVINTLTNNGTINGTIGIKNNATISNLINSGSISAILNSNLIGGAASIGLANSGTIVTLTNNGAINGTVDGVNNSGTISNLINSGSISTILNTGLIGGTTSDGLDNTGTIGSIDNRAGATIISSFSAIGSGTGTIGTLSNAGTITTANSTGPAIAIGHSLSGGSLGLLSNSGLISGSATAIKLSGSVGSVINSGIISASRNFALRIVGGAGTGSIGTIVNSGTIQATGPSAIAVFNAGVAAVIAALNNTIGGVIEGGKSGINNSTAGTIIALSNSGTIGGGVTGVSNAGVINTLTNSGTIISGGKAISNLGTILGTITNSGLIAGSIASEQALTFAGGAGGTVGTLTGASGSIGAAGIGAINDPAGLTFAAGSLLLNDNITANTVTNSGAALEIDNKISITGNYTQGTIASLIVGVNSAASYGELVGTGAINLANDAIDFDPLHGFTPLTGQVYTLASAGTLTAGGVEVTVPAGFGDIVKINGNDLLLTVVAWPLGTSITGAVTLGSGTASLTPSGAIAGGPTGILVSGGPTSIVNRGSIQGSLSGVSIGGGDTVSGLNNSGTIGGATGVKNSGTLTSIVNSGTISGSAAAIASTGSLGPITNSGLIAGNITAANPQDLTIAGGTGTFGTVTGSTGSIGSGDIGLITAHGVTFSTGTLVMNDNIKVNGGAGSVTNIAETLQLNNKVTINGSYSQMAAGDLVIGVASPTSYGELVGTGNVNLAGDNIAIASIDGGTLINGEILTIVSAGTLAASGVTVSVPAGFGETTSIVGNDLVVTIDQLPWPVLSASITGPATLSGGSGSLTPSGTIAGGDTGVLVNGNATSLTNQGLISATGAGVSVTSGNTLGGLNNSGTISGATGVKNSGTLTSIVNSGTISGSAAAIASTGSLGPITNSGLIAGNITAANPQDLTIAGGTGTFGTVTGSTGSITAGDIGLITAHGVTFSTGTLVMNDNIKVNGGAGSVTNVAETLQLNNKVTINGSYSQMAAGDLVIGVASPTSYGELVGTGNVNLAGDNIAIASIDGGTLINGEILTIVSAGTLAASGVTVSVPAGFGETTSIVGNDLVVTIDQLPWPVLSASISGPATLSGGSGSLTPSGTISGGDTGVLVNGNATSLTNQGLISAFGPGVKVMAAGSLSSLNNSGTISGATGVNNAGMLTSIFNSGTISGSAVGISNVGSLGPITNSGTISGRFGAIASTGSVGPITNSGLIAGNITAANPQDLTIAGGSGLASGTVTGAGGSIDAGDVGMITAHGVTFSTGTLVMNDNIKVNGGAGSVTNIAETLGLANKVTITGSYSQMAAGNLVIGVTSPTSYGELVATGNVNLAGDNVAILPIGAGLTNGEILTIVAAGTLAASGVSVSVPAGYTETTSIIGNDLVITIEQAPWPVLSASITGPATLSGGSGSLTPSGTIAGGPTGVLVNGNAASLTNQGLISATGAGVSVTAAGSLSGLNNSGTISGATGVKNDGTLTSIVNSGTISGSIDAIASAGSVGPITNSGLIAGNITAANPQDLTIAGGTGLASGTVTGSTGSIGSGDIGTIMAHGVTFSTGTLVMNDNINVNGGAGSVTNIAETLGLANKVTITGSYSQMAAGNLVIGVTSPTSYGELVATGNVNLAGDNVVILPIGAGLTNGEILTIVSAGTLAASGVSVSVPAGYTETTSIIGNDLVVTIEQAPWPLLSASITGPATLSGGSGSLTPRGTIAGGPTGVLVNGNATSLTNQGLIGATGAGVSVTSGTTLGGLNNSGTISGATGVKNTGMLTSIVNSGTISGSVNAIASTGSVGPITNSGLIAGNITAANPQDLTIAGGTGGKVGTVTGPGGSINGASVGLISAHGVTFSTGTLVMNDNIKVNGGAGTVTNVAETLQLNNKVTINGNYTQAGAASLVIGVASPTSYGELVGTGNVNLAGDDISIASIDGGTLINDEVLTIASGNGLTATGVSVGVPVGYTETTQIIGNELVVTIMANTSPGFPVSTPITGPATLTAGASGAITPTGTISGGPVGVMVSNNSATLTNAGIVSGSIAGVSVGAAGSLAALNNTGTIAATGSGTVTGNGGAVANTGSIASLINTGLLSGIGGATIGGVGVLNNNTIGTLTNSAGGVISGPTAAVQNKGALGGLSNSATLTSKAPTGVHNVAGAAIGQLFNAGTITGVNIGLNNAGALATIANTGTISGTGGGTVNGNDAAIVNRNGSIASLSNSGLVTGTGGATIGGIGLLNSNTIGALTNSAGGVISGKTVAVQNQGTLGALSNSATITSKADTGIHNFAGSGIGILSNTGTITGTNIGLNNAGTIATLSNAGLIDPPFAAVDNTGKIAVFTNSGTVSAAMTALLNSGILGKLTNSGTLSGAVAINNAVDGKIGDIANSGAILGNVINASATALTVTGASGSAWGRFAGTGSSSGTITSDAGLLFSGGNILLQDDIAVGGSKLSVANTKIRLTRAQTITGNYTQTGGALVIDVASTSKYGSFTVSGKASVSNTVVDLVGGGFARGQKYAIVNALGGGKYLDDIAELMGPNAGLKPTILVTPTTLYVEFLGPTYHQLGAAYDPTAGRIGTTLDRIASGTSATAVAFQNSILFDINSLPSERRQGAAIRELAPVEISPGALAAGNAVLASGAIEQHQLTTAYAYPGGDLEIGSGASESALWGQVLGGGTSRSSATDAEGYDASHFGIATGVDHQFTSNLFGGASFAWVRTDANGTDAQSGHKLNADSYFFSLYGTYREGPVFINGQVAGGWDNFHQERPIDFLGARASANYDGSQALARLQGGYDFRVQNVTVTPVAGLTWQRSWTDSFSEAGAGLADLGIDGHSVGTLEQDIGVKLNSAFKTSFGTVILDLRGEWLHDYTQGAFPTSGILAGQPFAVGSARPSADGALFTYGATLNRGDNTSVRLEGRSDVRSGYQSHSGVVKVIFGF